MTTALAVAPAAALERAVAATRARAAVEVEVLEASLAWALAHVVDDADPAAARWDAEEFGSPLALFGEQRIEIAGPGTPRIAEFAPMEFSAALRISHEAALAILGDALDLAFRLPRLLEAVRALRVPVHLAREAARASRDLTPEAADHADRLLCWQGRALNPHRVGVLVHEARLHADPDRAAADHDEALARRRVDVWPHRGAPGTAEVAMTLDLADALALDATLDAVASTMAELGHPGSRDERRAAGVGVLADPQRALDLLALDEVPVAARDTDPRVPVAEEAAFAPATPFPGGRPAPDEAVLFLHLDASAVAGSGTDPAAAVALHDELGALSLSLVARWLQGVGRVTVRPVVDHTALAPVDRHDPTPAMVRAARLRDPHCVFPGCRRRSRRADLDHVEPWLDPAHGGPPGQTRPDNLAPLCRRHHRAKTFGGFAQRRLADGSFRWTLPNGAVVVTDPSRPRPLARPLPRPQSRSSGCHEG